MTTQQIQKFFTYIQSYEEIQNHKYFITKYCDNDKKITHYLQYEEEQQTHQDVDTESYYEY